jgi:hypothetical protein
MAFCQFFVTIADDYHSSGIDMGATLCNQCLLFLGLKIMQHICKYDRIIIFKVKAECICGMELQLIIFQITVVGSGYLFRIIIDSRYVPGR